MKKKIAICLPSYNESHIISTTLLKVDKGLKKYINNYDVIIINIDNNSSDNTSSIFMNTKTICPKKSIITNQIGKGTNIIEFFKYCKNNNIDYAVTIDSDVRSMKSIWIDKFLSPLIENNVDYVTPIYKRSRFEGSTTNHFAYPVIYAISGIPIRQPIAGDFSFSKKFINIISKQPITDSITRYGIDIFMTLTACYSDLKIYQIQLEKKIHNPSYNKMEKMFQEVLDSFLFTWNHLNNKNSIKSQSKMRENNYKCIISSRNFKHREVAKNMYNKYLSLIKLEKDIEELWLDKLVNMILNVKTFNEEKREELFYIFMVRATDYWIKSEKISADKSEEILEEQAKELYKRVRKGLNHK